MLNFSMVFHCQWKGELCKQGYMFKEESLESSWLQCLQSNNSLKVQVWVGKGII